MHFFPFANVFAFGYTPIGKFQRVYKENQKVHIRDADRETIFLKIDFFPSSLLATKIYKWIDLSIDLFTQVD